MPEFTTGTTCWERVQDDKWTSVERMSVPSGWLYKVATTDAFRLSFVPALNEIWAMDALLEEARNHLGVAMVLALPEDNQIIVGHMREAHALLRAALKARRP